MINPVILLLVGQRVAQSFNGRLLKFGPTEVIFPPTSTLLPRSMVHFLGGTFLSTFPSSTYRNLIDSLSRRNYLVVCTSSPPLLGSLLDHNIVTKSSQREFNEFYDAYTHSLGGVWSQEKIESIPIMGIGHSIGAKVLVNMDAESTKRRHSANVMLSFNNFPAKASIPGLTEVELVGNQIDNVRRGVVAAKFRQLAKGGVGLLPRLAEYVSYGSKLGVSGEFNPSPAEVWAMVGKRGSYSVPNNLVVQFSDDEIDESLELVRKLNEKRKEEVVGGGELRLCRLEGTHVTPNGIGEGNVENLVDVIDSFFLRVVLNNKSVQSGSIW